MTRKDLFFIFLIFDYKIPRRIKGLFSTQTSQSPDTLRGSLSFLFNWHWEALSPWSNTPGGEADHSLPSRAELLKYLLRPKVMYIIGTSQYICYMLGTQTNISTWVHNNQISSQERSNVRIFSQNKFQCIRKTSMMTVSLGTYNSAQFFSHLWSLLPLRAWDPDVDGRIILRWTLRKWDGVVGIGWSWLRIGTGGGHLWVW
jgi:hypothetical protein